MSDDHLRPLPDQPNWRTQANCHPTNRPVSATYEGGRKFSFSMRWVIGWVMW